MYSQIQKEFEKKYDDLKMRICRLCKANCEGSEELYETRIVDLKYRYGKHIRSVRQLDAAVDVSSLFRLLEKRLALGWFNVDLLKETIDVFDIDGPPLDDYDNYVDELCRCKIRNKKAFLPSPYDPEIFTPIHSDVEVIPPQIMDVICSEMGHDWCHFARELINEELAVEADMDHLDESDLSPEEITGKLLEIFVRGDKRTKRSHLLKLLKAIHRNDLENKVNELFLADRD